LTTPSPHVGIKVVIWRQSFYYWE